MGKRAGASNEIIITVEMNQQNNERDITNNQDILHPFLEREAHINSLIKRVTLTLFNQPLVIKVHPDQKHMHTRLYLRIGYETDCVKTGENKTWYGRKWYLSDHMTDDEIIKTAYAAFEMAVKHEILEGFKVDGKSLFNPHVDFEELLKIEKEITR